MPVRELAAYFFGGVFLANCVPHLVAGVTGRDFHSPFAKPPFRGLSSPIVNVLWALFNLAVAYALVAGGGSFEAGRAAHGGVFVAGFGLWSLNVARSVTKLRARA